MKQAERTRTCSNCEADVNREATYCPFCGTDLLLTPISSKEDLFEGDEKFSSQSLQESLASLYKPPYSVRNRQGFGIPDERESATIKEIELSKEGPLFRSYEDEEITEKRPKEKKIEAEDRLHGDVLPLLLLSIGAHLLIVGLFLLFFSKDGVLTLEWNSRFWFLYCFFGIPLIGLAIHLFGKRKNPD